MSVTICPNCNEAVLPGTFYCDNCGHDLRNAASTPQQPVLPKEQAPQPTGEVNCPSCSHVNGPGSVFCENCGVRITRAETPVEPDMQHSPPSFEQQPFKKVLTLPVQPPECITGRLLIKKMNVDLPILPGKQSVIIGREDPVSGIFPEIDLDRFGGHEAGVGRRHAQLILLEGQLMVQDLETVNGTLVNGRKVLPGQPMELNDGYELRLGNMILIYSSS